MPIHYHLSPNIIHPCLLLLDGLVVDVVVVIHQFVDGSARCQFDDAVGHGLNEFVVVRGEKNVAFELLNEVTDESFIDAWNRISAECIRHIRPVAPESLILVGSYHNNAPDALKDLNAPADSKVIFNFHCYDPVSFTHQGAYWVPWLDRNERISFENADVDDDFFEKTFASAIETAAKHNTALYCGEYGVIDIVSPEDTVKWYKKIHDTFEKNEIARAAWNYRQMDFGLIDERMDSVREQLISLL